jgi:two-component system chemotaxis response regulator CheY
MYETLRFLVVDDNPTVRVIIKEILRGFGVQEFEAAADGKAALELLKTQPFDVVLTDMVMPGVSGVDLARAIRTGGTRTKADIPIVLLSGNMDRAALVAARDAGVTEFVAKPVVVASSWASPPTRDLAAGATPPRCPSPIGAAGRTIRARLSAWRTPPAA